MTQEPKQRRWLRFSIRGVLALMLLIAVVIWFLMPGPVQNADSVTDWEHITGSSEWVQMEPARLGRTNYYIYSDTDNDGKIDWMSQLRMFESAVAHDLDKDGFFDSEKRSVILWGWLPYSVERKIRIPVRRT